jgi:hypothetical protein
MAGPPPRKPQRRVTDHYHPEYWTEADHIRFEDRVSKEIHDLRNEVRGLGQRMSWLLGGLGVVIFIVNIVATVWIRASF